MNRYFTIILLIFCFSAGETTAQKQRYSVQKAFFSSAMHDEFSPVFYKNGIVFCSNQRDNSIAGFEDKESHLFKIFYLANISNPVSKGPRLLAKELTTSYNDGPVTFNEKGNIIYYSRNNNIENPLRNISDSSNKLGIYSSELSNGAWTYIKPFVHNNPLYTFYTPALSPDGKRIFFASDMPGGNGGMDLYYCDWRNNEWDKPVNMGPVINTSKNESFPFLCKTGKLFFASEGHNSFGGKDLFYTQQMQGKWITPVQLDSAINSPADDFGLVTDSTGENGYFSTNRRKTDDIFSFAIIPVEFENCEEIQENNYCFTFYDERRQYTDTVPVIYQWDFGDGIKHPGPEVAHCFPGAGEYTVKLSIIDELTGKAVADQVEYKVDLTDFEQAYINSYQVGMVGQDISFKGDTNCLKGFGKAHYWWNFGQGFKPGDAEMRRIFGEKGEHTVRLGLISEADSSGIIRKTCVSKKINICDTFQVLKPKDKTKVNPVGPENSSRVRVKSMDVIAYCMDDLSETQLAKIKEGMEEPGIWDLAFDGDELLPSSFLFLDHVGILLKDNPDIRLEIILHSMEAAKTGSKPGIPERRAQELAFYFKNMNLQKKAVNSKGYNSPRPVFMPATDDKKADESAEFVFMKN